MNTLQLETDLSNLYDATHSSGVTEADAKTAFINGLAVAIQTFVLSAKVVYVSGLVAPGGAVTGVFNGNLI